MSYPHSVALHRKRWALDQDELAGLLGVSQANVSRLEDGELARAAKLETVLALQIVFGHAPRTLFAPLHETIENAVMGRAAALDLTLRDRHDPDALKQKQLLSLMLKRATASIRTP